MDDKPHNYAQMWGKCQQLKLLHKKVLYYTYVYAMYVSNIVPDIQCFIWLYNGSKECFKLMIAYFKFMNFWNKFDNFFCLLRTKLYSGRKPTSTSICCWHKIAIVLFIHPPYTSCEKKTLITWKKIHYFGSHNLITFDTCLFS
jgi:hypothetical protein